MVGEPLEPSAAPAGGDRGDGARAGVAATAEVPERVAGRVTGVRHGTAPGPRDNPILGSVRELRRQGPLQFYIDLWRQYGDVARHRLGLTPVHLIVHPDHVEYILRTHEENFPRGTIVEHRGKRVLGQGLIMTEGEPWQRMRHLMEPPFSQQGVVPFTAVMTAAGQHLCERWDALGDQPDTLEMTGEMMRLSMSIISRATFSVDLSDDTAHLKPAFDFILEYLQDLILAIVPMPEVVPTAANRRFRASMRAIHYLIDRQIEAHQSRPDRSGNDLLSHFLQARDETTGQGMSAQQLHDELLVTLVAAQENTALLLTWTWYLLSQHPEVERRLHEEIDRVLGGRTPTFEDTQSLTFTRRVLEESLRLYPPLWGFTRTVKEDDEIGEYLIPAGSTVLVNPYLAHRHPDIWENPEVFDPDRFTPERSRDLPRYAFLPFAGGKHKCIGNKFAMLAGLVTVSMVAQRYRLRLATDRAVTPMAQSTLRPAHGVHMRLERR